MSLEPVEKLMADARRGGYAIGYFESWNLESLQGVLDAAEAVSAPIILGFNGEFLCHAGRRAAERLALYGALGKAAAESSPMPCGLIFNECPDDSWVLAAAECGFNLVMPADPQAPYDDYLRRVKRIVEFSHQRRVAVEAELDELPCGASGRVEGEAALTDPARAERFVRETGVDLLAVSVGNVHIRTSGEQALNLDHLAVLADRVRVPLVLHGGSGISANSLKEAIRLGVAKVNYGTYVKQRYLAAVRAAIAANPSNPHELLGLGGKYDVMVAGRLAVRAAVLERIEMLGCCGKAR
ncbi:MAG: class II fructose-bisphosphate aldolase [Opitutaceae bacterium]|nr:class II fructose-bisphosphate aldolase [Opitutaceae bacterium]